MKVLLLSRYSYLAASSRYRFYQYLPYLKSQGINVGITTLLDDNHLQQIYFGSRSNSYAKLMQAYWNRLSQVWQSQTFDLVWLQMESFPWLPGWLESLFLRMAPPYIVDYDDAWFHRYDQHSSVLVKGLLRGKIDSVMRNAMLVVAGNKYIAERAERARARRIEILPTVIDLARYQATEQPHNETFTIGWLGSPSSDQWLQTIRPALQEVCRDKNVKVVTVGAKNPNLDDIPLEMRQWSDETEVQEIQKFDVGIMPLTDSLWERGKCGFKLIQYMACARPVVASPVGVNSEIVTHGVNGFLASTQEEWVTALRTLKNDVALRQRMGEAGRKRVEERYCLQVTAPRLAELLREAAGKQCAELAADYN